VGICHQKHVLLLLLPHATSARKCGRSPRPFGHSYTNCTSYTSHLCTAICTKQFHTACRSPSIGARLKQILPQIFSYLGAFAKSRKATVSFVMFFWSSVRLSVWNNSAYTWRIFKKVDIWLFFEKSVQKIPISLKSDNNNGGFYMKTDIQSRWILLCMKNVADKRCGGNQNKFYVQ
jgi:hypothetical protein